MKAEPRLVLLQTKDLPDGESRGLKLPAEAGGGEGFAVRRGEEIFVYSNSCPHTGAPLDWSPDQFLNAEGSHIICAMHGALFEVDSGLCVSGPCVNQYLQPIPAEIDGEKLVIKLKGN